MVSDQVHRSRYGWVVSVVTVVLVIVGILWWQVSHGEGSQGQNHGGTVPTVGTYVPASIPTTTFVLKCTPGYSSNPECPDFVPAPGTPGNSGG